MKMDTPSIHPHPGLAGVGKSVEITALRKTYGKHVVLDDVSLTLQRGEFLAILGASGSGKSTLLMALAGFVEADSGSIRLDGRDITHLPANKRGFGVMFQNYALFPHMTVLENILYPLKLRRVPRPEAVERAMAALATVKLDHLAARRIDALSGGQRQRVALARAIVYEPEILLMDEPLSALDKSLREEMQIEIRELHEKLGITTLYVTHDQREALTIADRVAVMRDGRFEQIAPPEEIYRRPSSAFVAEFLGEAILFDPEEQAQILSGLPAEHDSDGPLLMMRSEDMQLVPWVEDAAPVTLTAELRDIVFQGDSWLVKLRLGTGREIAIRAQRVSSSRIETLAPGQSCTVYLRRDALHYVGRS
ncbi:ABC transporter ATP-binding protein [Salipiger sp. P9]|uniref:ABC transporter ATP-binding protein n=1 Tax=Salipiger pentaromativorans TaxID=2943193 RepID=UPI0021580204|nr:ABC transporter ATP-binding protein [Salipiger pentaromativorans]MCR8548394.1 ABC transporter ATP-binding protein [Salipiger pentaromativorans]